MAGSRIVDVPGPRVVDRGAGNRPAKPCLNRTRTAALALALAATGLLHAQSTSTGSASTIPGQPPAGSGAGAEGQQAAPAASTVQTPGTAPTVVGGRAVRELASGPSASLWQYQGLTVDRILFAGVTFTEKETLPSELTQKAGQPLDPDKVRDSTRRLFASGEYRDIAVRAERSGDRVTLIFAGVPRYFVGRITILGVKSERLTSLLEFATKLDPGTPFSPAQVPAGTEGIRQTLEQNGYFEPKIQPATARHPETKEVDVTYNVAIGPQARVGSVAILGDDPGITEKDFRKKGKLKAKTRVTRDTTSNALANVRAVYQKKDRLEGTITLTQSAYDAPTDRLNYTFTANQGPEVKVVIEGVKVSKARLKLLIPIFEEGTIDNDLLNEGSHNIKDFLQQQGYFDAKVEVRVLGEGSPSERVVYTADRGVKHKVLDVTFAGNKYFSDDILRERARVQKADAFLRNGRFSQALVSSDEDAIASIYRANGFSAVKVTAAVKDVDEKNGKPLKVASVAVAYTVVEGPQQTFGSVDFEGINPSRNASVRALLNTQAGQPFSLLTLSGDRDAVLSFYLSQGFDQAKVNVKQTVDAVDKSKTDIAFNVDEGAEVAVDQVLRTGLNHTRPTTVDPQIKVHPNDPLDQTALLDTQRNLYNLALFNEVVAAVQNPSGQVPEKNILLQLVEARRWDVTYGFGFEAQTGTPVTGNISEASRILLGLPPNQNVSQNGRAGVSPRVSLDVSRVNLRGTQQSLTLHTAYGLLETIATLTYNYPNLRGNPKLTGSLTGGYTNVQNISTFQASTLQGDLRVTQRLNRVDTFIYDFQYRRVSVNPNSLQVSANLIPLLSQPVRVGGPGVTWFHDRRSPSQLDATKGSYTTIAEFVASDKFGSQTNFNRVDGSNSTYYSFGKRKYVFARNTRIGIENSWAGNPNATNSVCAGVLLTTNASCSAVPLPERLYAGGATSHRGFSINGAGPRDLQTGYPVGGTAVLVNQLELRLPAPVLPVVGSSVSFVVFHDMGNVFQNAKDLFPSFLHYHQPNQQTCRDVSSPAVTTSHVGTCSFNYYSHAIGLGARYNTPVGPIRVDLSYNLNPPVYPVLYDFNNNPPYVGQASHVNFFFSIGQSF